MKLKLIWYVHILPIIFDDATFAAASASAVAASVALVEASSVAADREASALK